MLLNKTNIKLKNFIFSKELCIKRPLVIKLQTNFQFWFFKLKSIKIHIIYH